MLVRELHGNHFRIILKEKVAAMTRRHYTSIYLGERDRGSRDDYEDAKGQIIIFLAEQGYCIKQKTENLFNIQDRFPIDNTQLYSRFNYLDIDIERMDGEDENDVMIRWARKRWNI